MTRSFALDERVIVGTLAITISQQPTVVVATDARPVVAATMTPSRSTVGVAEGAVRTRLPRPPARRGSDRRSAVGLVERNPSDARRALWSATTGHRLIDAALRNEPGWSMRAAGPAPSVPDVRARIEPVTPSSPRRPRPRPR